MVMELYEIRQQLSIISEGMMAIKESLWPRY